MLKQISTSTKWKCLKCATLEKWLSIISSIHDRIIVFKDKSHDEKTTYEKISNEKEWNTNL